MPGKPSLQFYPGDWWRANDIKGCSMTTQGIWFNLLMAMWDSKEQGKIRDTKEGICRIIGAKLKELNEFIEDNNSHKFANVTFRNEKVTIINRRMYRAYIEREGTKKRVQKHRKHKKSESNVNVTPYSSTSTSFKEKEYKEKEIFNVARKYYPGEKRGLDTEFACLCKNHKDWKEVLPLLLPAIKAEENRRTTKERVNKFVPPWKHFKTWLYNRCWEMTIGQTVTHKEKTNSEQRILEEKKAQVREDYGQYYQEKSVEELEVMRKDKALFTHWWLIDEILAERKEQ